MDYRSSRIWRSAMDLSIAIHRNLEHFPKGEWSEKGLCSRVLVASVKVCNRIADSQRQHEIQPYDMLLLARYHLSETEFLLDCCRFMDYIGIPKYQGLLMQIEDLRGRINLELAQFHKPIRKRA